LLKSYHRLKKNMDKLWNNAKYNNSLIKLTSKEWLIIPKIKIISEYEDLFPE